MMKKLRAFGREEKGIASVEFALLFPFVFFMSIWTFELGLLMTKSVMLEHSVDVAVRDLRLGNVPVPTTAALKTAICDRARVIADCHSTIVIDSRAVQTATWNLPPRNVQCREADDLGQPLVGFAIGGDQAITLVRVCVYVQPLFPGTGIGAMLEKEPDGTFGMSAITAFVREPT